MGERTTDATVLLLSFPYLPLSSPGQRWFLGPTIGLGIVALRARAQDLPFAELTMEGGRTLTSVAGNTGGIAARAGVGLEMATPFDTATTQLPGVERHTVLTGVGRVELLFHARPAATSPAAMTLGIGRTIRFGSEIQSYGLTDSWFWRFGVEVSTR